MPIEGIAKGAGLFLRCLSGTGLFITLEKFMCGPRRSAGLFFVVAGVDQVDLLEKLTILTDAAKYDVACTSSGAGDSAPRGSGIGSTADCGICHSGRQTGAASHCSRC